jgi:hypothetical protein
LRATHYDAWVILNDHAHLGHWLSDLLPGAFHAFFANLD